MKGKISKKLGSRGVIVLGVLLVASTLAMAGLLTYFGEIRTTVTVHQSVMIDDHEWNDPVLVDLGEMTAGDCKCDLHNLKNNGCEGVWVDWEHELIFGDKTIVDPADYGIYITIRLPNPDVGGIVMNVLDGIADDSFAVYVDEIEEPVYTYTDKDLEKDEEIWIEHHIDVTSYKLSGCESHTITIEATGPQWEYFDTYGQLAVDWIGMYCGFFLKDVEMDKEKCCWGDWVDIGCPDAGHNLQGWGPPEPETHGGNWGGFGPDDPYTGDCCVTWYLSENGRTEDEPWASVELDCDIPCEGECNCCTPEVYFPAYVSPEFEHDICICYKLDILTIPDDYVISSKLVPVIL